MGAGSSKQTLVGLNSKGVVDKARISKELADRILTVFFSKADFRDILTLSSISQCPRYVFTTADALQSLFQSLEVYPNLGKQGEIIFAPIAKLSPGIFKDKSDSSQEVLERTKLRNQMCIDVAYFYVRIFQIYAALAMTVLDTDPTRRRTAYVPSSASPSSWFSSQPARGRPGFGSAPLMGGELPKTGIPRQQMLQTSFEPLVDYLTVSKKNSQYLVFDDKITPMRENVIYIYWDTSKLSPASKIKKNLTLEGRYIKKDRTDIKFSITMQESSPAPDREVTLYINGTEIQKFKEGFTEWSFVADEDDDDFPKRFYEKMHDYFRTNAENANEPKSAISKKSVSSSSSNVGISITSGKTSFDNFDKVKKLYEDRYVGKEFPKAYCTARAMILMTPLFESERVVKTMPYYSQICKKTYDFEATNLDAMPRAGKQPKANVYFNSLVSLYYDDYEVRNGEVFFKQTESGRSELRAASAKIAQLYDIQTNPESFLESNTPFKNFKMCDGKDVLLQFREDPNGMKLRQLLTNEVITPMLKFQDTHTAQVNALFKKMFDIAVDKEGRPTMAFTAPLKKGGRQVLNEFGRQARNLLLQYYTVSEAYYIKGVRLFETNPNGLIPV